jgi:dihydroxyacetone synthase
VIGLGTSSAGTFKAHHGAFDAESVAESKRLAGQDPSTSHQIPSSALEYFRERKQHGQKMQSDWESLLEDYRSAHPELAEEFRKRRAGENGGEWRKSLDAIDSKQFSKKATREVNGTLMETLWKTHPALTGGGADLINSNKVAYDPTDVFHPSVGYTGRYIRYGIREHAMASISNGLSAYSPGTFLPFTATFFMFYIYVSLVPS